MEENKFLKIFALVAFVAFAVFSCWSTTESLFLSLEHAQIPKWIFWIAVVGLYVLTSFCFKLLVSSFSKNYVENRIFKLIMGLLGMLILWVAFSLPTNTHTFFYKQMAKNTAVKELKHIDGELDKLSSEDAFIMNYQTEWDKYEMEVHNSVEAIKREIRDFQNAGLGPKAEARIADAEDKLGLKTGDIVRIQPRDKSQRELNKVCEYYDNAIKGQLEKKKEQHQNNLVMAVSNFQNRTKGVHPISVDIKKVLALLDDNQYDREAVLKEARQVIARGYAELESTFNGLYTKDESIYRSERLVNVMKVWGDYFKGNFRKTDYTLWYWILLSVIVDIAAFAFFAIAFKKEEY